MNGTEQFTLVGIVNGNPRGCRDKRLFPDFHASVGNEEVVDIQICFDSFFFRQLKNQIFKIFSTFEILNWIKINKDVLITRPVTSASRSAINKGERG